MTFREGSVLLLLFVVPGAPHSHSATPTSTVGSDRQSALEPRLQRDIEVQPEVPLAADHGADFLPDYMDEETALGYPPPLPTI
jgi:hypothetical protein